MPDHFYVYPAYLARGVPRKAGRRLSATEGFAELSSDEIVAAATRLGYRAVAEADKQYPRDVAAWSGRVKVTKRAGVTKGQFLKLLAAELRQRRAAGGRT